MIKRIQIVKERLVSNRGFTLIEVIAVLIILAIIGAVVISRVAATNNANLQSEVNSLKGHLRYAQSLAMNNIYTTNTTSANYATRTKWGINVGSSSYTLVKYVADANANSTSPLPNESSATHTFANGITASVSTGNNPILFDSWGSPGTSSTTVSIGSQSITITAETGFIP